MEGCWVVKGKLTLTFEQGRAETVVVCYYRQHELLDPDRVGQTGIFEILGISLKQGQLLESSCCIEGLLRLDNGSIQVVGDYSRKYGVGCFEEGFLLPKTASYPISNFTQKMQYLTPSLYENP